MTHNTLFKIKLCNRIIYFIGGFTFFLVALLRLLVLYHINIDQTSMVWIGLLCAFCYILGSSIDIYLFIKELDIKN